MSIVFIVLYIFSFIWNPWVESRSRHTIFFFNESLCRATLENIGREVAPQRFLFQSKSASHAEVAPLCFYFRTHFPFSRYRRGQRSRHVLFSLHIRHPTQATRERNSTAPAPFSPSLLDAGHPPIMGHNQLWLSLFRYFPNPQFFYENWSRNSDCGVTLQMAGRARGGVWIRMSPSIILPLIPTLHTGSIPQAVSLESHSIYCKAESQLQLNLNCLVLGDDASCIFQIKIAKSKTIVALRGTIHWKNEFNMIMLFKALYHTYFL